MSKLGDFIKFCRELQPQGKEDVQRFFESVIFFPYDNELLLQSFLFLNISDYFPYCVELLLFESAPKGVETNEGKCDFVFLTQNNRIALIETKFIDTEDSGSTERTRRNKHRKKVFNQVTALKEQFTKNWSIQPDFMDCCVFTTEDLTYRDESTGIDTKYVSVKELRDWQQATKGQLQSRQ